MGIMKKRIISMICALTTVLTSFGAILPVKAAWDGYEMSETESVDVVDFNNITKLNSKKNGGSISNKYTRDGNMYSIYWGDHEKNGTLEVLIDKKLADWSQYEFLNMWIYSEKATGESVWVMLHSKRATDGICYIEEDPIVVDWTGWKFISIRMSRLWRRTRTLDKTAMETIALRAERWEAKGKPDTELYIADMKLAPLPINSAISLNYDKEIVEQALAGMEGNFAVYANSDNVVTDGGAVTNMKHNAFWKEKTLWLAEDFFSDFLKKDIKDVDGLKSIESDGVKYYAAADTGAKLGFSTYTDGRFAMFGSEESLKYYRRDAETVLNTPSEVVKYFACHKNYDLNKNYDEDLKKLKDNWRNTLLGTPETNDMTNPVVKKMVDDIAAAGNDRWKKLKHTPQDSELFEGLKVKTIGNVSTAYNNLFYMAKAWGTPGSSLYKNEQLRDDILYAIRWMNDNAFGNTAPLRYPNGGWFNWEIGVPMILSKVLIIMEHELSGDEMRKYTKYMDTVVGYPDDSGANTVRFAYSLIASAALNNNAAEIIQTNARVEEEMLYKDDVLNWRDADVGQGFHSDGSYVFHYNYSMNGLYGLEAMETVSEYLQVLNGTAFMPSTHSVDYIADHVFKAFDSLIYRGAMYRMTMARKDKHDQYALGARLMVCMLRIMDWADEEDTAAMKSIIKEYEANTSQDYYSSITPYEALKLYDILNSPDVVSRDGAEMNKMYHNMDQMVHSRKDYGVGLAMHSSRIMSYESYDNENMKSWYMSDGRYQYVLPGSEKNEGRSYWVNVNYYKLPGTTVDTQERQAVAFGDVDGYRSSKDFVGGVSDGEYGASTMHLESFRNSGEKNGHPLHTNDLEAKKSYFMFDDEIVCLGSDINAKNNNNAEVLTVIDNRMAENVTTVSKDGEAVKPYDIIAYESPDAPDQAPNTVDGDLTTIWALETESTITWDIGEVKPIGFLAIAFARGATRKQYFKIELSEDGRVWNTIAEPESSGTTELYEPYDMLGTPARYVRFTNLRNSRGDKWISLSDIRIYPYAPGNKIEMKEEVYTGSEKVTVDGRVMEFKADTLDVTGARWAHLENSCGYYFPESNASNPMFMKWTPNNISFFEFWMSHGQNPTDKGYAYAILPGKTSDETKAYAENPSFEILSNTKDIQAVKNIKLGITQIVFHKAGSIAGITADKPMIVMVREKRDCVEVTISDPTQKLTGATVKLDRSLGDVINKDIRLTSEGEGNTIIKADFVKSKGRSMAISFVK